jgi:hypothetical protein
MKFVLVGIEGIINYYEDKCLIRENNLNHYVGSGGLGYTNELSPENLQAKLSEMWSFGLAQEFTDVSPAQHDEFCLQYQLPVLNRMGLTAYGCCEPYTHKFDMIKKIKNLRRVSVSPWCDIKKASEALEDKYIYSFKPDPAMIAIEPDEETLRKYFKNVLNAAKDNHLEIILKDTITVENHPERFKIWLKILREEM